MKKSLRPILAAAIAASALAMPAGAAVEPEVGQEISGTIAVSNPSKAALPVTRHQRSTIFVGSASQDTVAHYFEVDEDTYGGLFDLSSSAGEDMDIIFYANPGNLTDANEGATEFAGAGAESGIVPAGATYGVIYPASGVNVPFTYTATEAQTILLSGDLDVTIQNGQRLIIINDTESDGYVRSEKFTSGDSDTSLRAGESIVIDSSSLGILFGAADVAYDSHMGAGTISVNP